MAKQKPLPNWSPQKQPWISIYPHGTYAFDMVNLHDPSKYCKLLSWWVSIYYHTKRLFFTSEKCPSKIDLETNSPGVSYQNFPRTNLEGGHRMWYMDNIGACYYARWCPPVISWLIDFINYRYITNKNHRNWSICTNLANDLGHRLLSPTHPQVHR